MFFFVVVIVPVSVMLASLDVLPVSVEPVSVDTAYPSSSVPPRKKKK
jgi:hypothetical protein